MKTPNQLVQTALEGRTRFLMRVAETISDAAAQSASAGNHAVTLTVDEILGQIFKEDYPDKGGWTDFWYRTALFAFQNIEEDLTEALTSDGAYLSISNDLVVCTPGEAEAVSHFKPDDVTTTMKQARVVYFEWWELPNEEPTQAEDEDYALQGDVPPALKHTV